MTERGAVWLVDFGDPIGHEPEGVRPAVVVSSTAYNRSPAGLVLAIPFTRTQRPIPLHIEVQPGTSGLATTSYATCDDLRSLSTRRLVRELGRLDVTDLVRIEQVLRRLLVL